MGERAQPREVTPGPSVSQVGLPWCKELRGGVRKRMPSVPFGTRFHLPPRLRRIMYPSNELTARVSRSEPSLYARKWVATSGASKRTHAWSRGSHSLHTAETL